MMLQDAKMFCRISLKASLVPRWYRRLEECWEEKVHDLSHQCMEISLTLKHKYYSVICRCLSVLIIVSELHKTHTI